jgi:hypothetical protein
MPDAFLVDPIELTDAELDAIAGGQITQEGLVAVNVSDIEIAVPVNAAVAVGLLNQRPVTADITRPGRINFGD